MRELTSNKVNECNEGLSVAVMDEPGAGGANHHYSIGWIEQKENFSSTNNVQICFQNGPIKEVGTNGVTHEALLAIVEDRLKSFQAGPYACRENAIALTKIQEAMHWLHHRTRERLARGVEGTHQK